MKNKAPLRWTADTDATMPKRGEFAKAKSGNLGYWADGSWIRVFRARWIGAFAAT